MISALPIASAAAALPPLARPTDTREPSVFGAILASLRSVVRDQRPDQQGSGDLAVADAESAKDAVLAGQDDRLTAPDLMLERGETPPIPPTASRFIVASGDDDEVPNGDASAIPGSETRPPAEVTTPPRPPLGKRITEGVVLTAPPAASMAAEPAPDAAELGVGHVIQAPRVQGQVADTPMTPDLAVTTQAETPAEGPVLIAPNLPPPEGTAATPRTDTDVGRIDTRRADALPSQDMAWTALIQGRFSLESRDAAQPRLAPIPPQIPPGAVDAAPQTAPEGPTDAPIRPQPGMIVQADHAIRPEQRGMAAPAEAGTAVAAMEGVVSIGPQRSSVPVSRVVPSLAANPVAGADNRAGPVALPLAMGAAPPPTAAAQRPVARPPSPPLPALGAVDVRAKPIDATVVPPADPQSIASPPPAAQPITLASQQTVIAPPPHHSAELAQSVARQIAVHVPPQGAAGFDLTLAPEELGSVRIKLVAQDGGSLLIVHSDRPETLDLMRRHIGVLEQDLRSLGHDQLSVRFTGGALNNGPGAGHSHGGAGFGQTPGQDRQSQPDRGPTSDAGPAEPRSPAPARRQTDHLDLRL